MSIRSWLNQHSALGTILAVVVVIVALGVFVLRTHNPADRIDINAREWYFDMQTGKIFAGPFNSQPPITAPSGENQGVRAYIFSCGDCPPDLEGKTAAEVEQAGAFIGWLHMYTEQAKKAMVEPEDPENMDPALGAVLRQQRESGNLVRRPQDQKWRIHEQVISELQEAVQQRCGQELVVECRPQ